MLLASGEFTVAPLNDGVPDKFYRAWANSPDGKLDFSTTNSVNKTHFGTYVGSKVPTSYSQYDWTMIKGQSGENGKTSYTWVKYADTKDGEGISDSPEGKIYLGLAPNKDTDKSSNTPSDYKWSAMYDLEALDGVTLRDKTEILSGNPIFTDKADDNSVVHVDVDGKSYQNVGSGKNLAPNPEHWTYTGTARYENGNIIIPKGGANGASFWVRWDGVTGSPTYSLDGVSGSGFLANMSYYAEDKTTPVKEASGQWSANGMIVTYTTDNRKSWTYVSYDINMKWIKFSFSGADMYTPTDAVFTNFSIRSDRSGEFEPPAPSPDYPVTINSLNNVDVVSSVGKENLISVPQTQYSFIKTNASGYQDMLKAETTELSYPESQYTLSFRAKASSPMTLRSHFYAPNTTTRTETSTGHVGSSSDGTANTNIGTEWDSYWIKWEQSPTIEKKSVIIARILNEYSNITLEIENIKFEGGSVATPYTQAPVNTQPDTPDPTIYKTNISLPEPLRSVGNVKDRLFRDTDGLWKVERNVGEKIFDGSEAFSWYNSPYIATPKSAVFRNPILSSHHTYNNSPTAENGKVSWGGTPNSNKNMFFGGVGSWENVSDFRNWVKSQYTNGNPLTVQYVLEIPTIETLPDDMQQKLNNIQSYKGSNYVYTVLPDKSDILPTLHATFKSIGWYDKWKTSEDLKDVNSSLSDLEKITLPALSDGLLNKAEKESIKQSLNLIEAEKKSLDARYNSIYANGNLTGTTKTNLYNAKVVYNTAHSELKVAITDVLNTVENTRIDSKLISKVETEFSEYGAHLSVLQTRFEESLDAISGKKVNDVNTELGKVAQRVSNAESKITDSAITNVVTSSTTFANVKNAAESAKSTLDTKASTWDGKATTGYVDGKASTAEANAKSHAENKILEDKSIKDTRNDNQLPSWYFTNYPKQVVREFKPGNIIGAPESAHGVLTTDVPWSDSSGGSVKQEFRVGNKTYKRSGSTTSWTAWVDYDGLTDTVNTELGKVISRVSTAESKITDTAITNTVRESTQYKNDLTGKVSTNEVISKINQSAETIQIEAKNVNFKGAVTFESFDTATKNTINDKSTKAEAQGYAEKESRVQNLSGGSKKFMKLGGLDSSVSSLKGYLVIKTPLTSSYMTRLKISGYNYVSGNTNIDLAVGFYAFTSNTFHQYSYLSSGDFAYSKVQLARDSSGRSVIIIGEASTSYSYPKISIDEAIIGHTTPPDSFVDGWSAEITTNISAYSVIVPNVGGGDLKLDINSAQTTADNAKNAIADMSSDNKITPVEKVQLKKEWATISAEKPSLDSVATTYGVTTEKTNLGNAYNTLNTALNGSGGILTNMTSTSSITGSTFRNQFDDYYDKKALLMKKINETSRSLANNAQGTADTVKGVVSNFDSSIINPNPIFLDWTGATPAGYGGSTGLAPTKVASGNGMGNAIKYVVAANSNTYLNPNVATTTPFVNYVTVEFTFMLESGSVSGAGVLLRYNATSSVDHRIHIKADIPSPTLNKWYTVTKVIKQPTEPSGFIGYSVWPMGGWTTFDAVTTKTIQFDSVKARPSTEQEINAYESNIMIADMSMDSKVTPVEKVQLKKEWATINAERASIDGMAATYGITTERTNMTNAYNTLNTVLNGTGGILTNMNITSVVVGSTFRAQFDDYYDKKAILQRKINETARTLANNAQSGVNGINGKINNAVTTIDGTGVTVRDGSFYLKDDTSDTKYSLQSKSNLIRNHGLEMYIPRIKNGLDDNVFEFTTEGRMGNDVDYSFLTGRPYITTSFIPDDTIAGGNGKNNIIFGTQSGVVRSNDYFIAKIAESITPGDVYTASFYTMKPRNLTGGVPAIRVRTKGSTNATIVTKTFPQATVHGEAKRYSVTFTVPTTFKATDVLEIDFYSSNTNWIIIDGLQLVEGANPVQYADERVAFDMLNGQMNFTSINAQDYIESPVGYFDSLNARILEPTLLGAGTNLNSLTDPGFYYTPLSADARTMSNAPIDVAFSLEVQRHAGALQILNDYQSDYPRMFYRNYYNGRWGHWRQIASRAHTPMIQSGEVWVRTTPNTMTGVNVTFEKSFPSMPRIVVTAHSGANALRTTTINNPSPTGFLANVYRTDSVDTRIFWIAVEDTSSFPS